MVELSHGLQFLFANIGLKEESLHVLFSLCSAKLRVQISIES